MSFSTKLAARARTRLSQIAPGARRAISASHVQNSKKVVFSGIQPTGVPHLGNYLGALKQWVRLQDTADPDTTLLFCSVDLHAVTVPQAPAVLAAHRRQCFASLLAIGLDPSRSIVFHQSAVPAHSELMWLLSCSASVGYLSRMTQWKSKIKEQSQPKPMESAERLGLFSYPVLQAADILVHGATHVPVGEDQAQHLEFTRNCAASFNAQYREQAGDILPIPETMLSPARRIMSLSRPQEKMSKSSANEKSRILITDSADEIERKIKAAVTDSESGVTYDPEKRPGVSNLIDMLYYILDESVSREALVADVQSKSAFKGLATGIITQQIAPIRESYLSLMAPEKAHRLREMADEGAMKARSRAEATMLRVREAVGLS